MRAPQRPDTPPLFLRLLAFTPFRPRRPETSLLARVRASFAPQPRERLPPTDHPFYTVHPLRFLLAERPQDPPPSAPRIPVVLPAVPPAHLLDPFEDRVVWDSCGGGPEGTTRDAGEWRVETPTRTGHPPPKLGFEECLAVERMETRWEETISWDGEYRETPLCIDTPGVEPREAAPLSGEMPDLPQRDRGVSLVECVVDPPLVPRGTRRTLVDDETLGVALAAPTATAPVTEVRPAATDFVLCRVGGVWRVCPVHRLFASYQLFLHGIDVHPPTHALWRRRAHGLEARAHRLCRSPACDPDALARAAARAPPRLTSTVRALALRVQNEPWNVCWGTDLLLRGLAARGTRVVVDEAHRVLLERPLRVERRSNGRKLTAIVMRERLAACGAEAWTMQLRRDEMGVALVHAERCRSATADAAPDSALAARVRAAVARQRGARCARRSPAVDAFCCDGRGVVVRIASRPTATPTARRSIAGCVAHVQRRLRAVAPCALLAYLDAALFPRVAALGAEPDFLRRLAELAATVAEDSAGHPGAAPLVALAHELCVAYLRGCLREA